ncbi:MAG: acyl carrier protein [Planctomycetota bacterium]|jgi:acyl carrier protein
MSTEAVVRQKIGEICGIEPASVRAEARLIEHGIDSVRAMDLVIELEEEFDIEVPDEDLAGVATVGELIQYVERRRA